ncbi:uncharacterized protein LOC134230055 [Saccostrea cucullata]|uniref:uncharacterized protein LOC134230055 n=1 Tax=Saccostrea cuccullata TaxID=36930 RepID=UPI002ED02CEA
MARRHNGYYVFIVSMLNIQLQRKTIEVLEAYTDAIGDHFAEEFTEDASLEWDCFADENYDIICHAEKVDDFYWADISKTQSTDKKDYPVGDGQSLDQNSSSLQTTIWTPFKEKIPRKENSTELLSATSSMTDYFSCFDSDSDDEERKETRHFDAEFSSLNLCLNISVTDRNNEPRIFITTKTERKNQSPEGNSRWLSEETDLLCNASESSFLSEFDDYEFINFSDLHSMVNDQNNLSVTRYRLVDISDSDMEYFLEHVPEADIQPKEFLPSWCQIFKPSTEEIFKPSTEETEKEVTKHDVRSIVDSFESLIKAEEDSCKTSSPKIRKDDQVNVKVETELVKRAEKNFETNTQETVTTFIMDYEEDYTDECFQVFRKLSERIIQESFHELELESQCDLSLMNTEQVMPCGGGIEASNFEGEQSQFINTTKYLSIEEKKVPLGQEDDEKFIMALEATKIKDQATKLTIQAQMNCEREEIVKSIFYTQEKFSLPSEMPIQIKEKYFEQSNAHTSKDIAMIDKGSMENETDQEVWRKQGQLVPVACTSVEIPSQVIISTLTPVYNALEEYNDHRYICAGDTVPKAATFSKPPASYKENVPVRIGQQNREYNTRSFFTIFLDHLDYTSAPVQEYIQEEQEMVWNKFGQIVPVKENCSNFKQEQNAYSLLPFQQENSSMGEQKSKHPLQTTSTRSTGEENIRTVVPLQKNLFDSQKGDGQRFRNAREMRNGKIVPTQVHIGSLPLHQADNSLYNQKHLNPMENTPFRTADKEKNRTLESLQKNSFETQKGVEQRFENTKRMRCEQIVPVEEDRFKTTLEHLPLHQAKISQGNQEQKDPLQNASHNIADRGYNRNLACLQKTLFESQNGDGHSFMNVKGMKDGKTTQHTKEELCGPVSKYTQKRRSRMTQDKPQETRSELTNVRNISEVLGKIEKICLGKTVHLRQEYIIQDKGNISTDIFKLASDHAAVPNPCVFQKSYEPARLNSEKYQFKKGNRSSLPASDKNTKKSHGTGQVEDDGNRENTLKLQYQSAESTIRLEYTRQDEVNAGLQNKQEQDLSLVPAGIPGHQEPLPINKHSKRIIEHGKTVYMDENSWRSQGRVAKLCKIFEDSGSKVPKITYRLSQGTNKSPAVKPQPRLIVKEEGPKQATSKKEDKSPKRFDFDRYLQKRGENLMTRKDHNDISDESYYHVAKLLTIRIIANARIEVSREYIEHDYSKQKTARKEKLDVPPRTSFPQSTCCSANMLNDKICRRDANEFAPHHSKQTSELTQLQRNKKNEKPKNVVSSKTYRKTSKEEAQPREYEERKASGQHQGRQRVWLREAEQCNGYLPNPPIDQKRKRVQFDV